MNAPRLTIDPTSEGLQHGAMLLPTAGRMARPARSIPFTVLARGSGPTIAIVGGPAPTEPAAALAIASLARDLALDAIGGRLILVPTLAPEFTGPNCDVDLGAGCSIGDAHAVEALFQLLLGDAGLVVELRAGDAELDWSPCAMVRAAVGERRAAPRAEAAMVAFGAPDSVRIHGAPDSSTALGGHHGEAAAAHLEVRLGGGVRVSAEGIDEALIGCRNVLVHEGLLDATLALRASRRLAFDPALDVVKAATCGLLELRARLGRDVHRGDLLARIIDPARGVATIEEVRVPRDGVLLARRQGGRIFTGDAIALIGDEIQA